MSIGDNLMEKHEMEFIEPQIDFETQQAMYNRHIAENRYVLKPNEYKVNTIVSRLKRIVPYIMFIVLLFIVKKYIPTEENKFFDYVRYADYATIGILFIRAFLILVGVIK